jgi:hypothetical protein
VTLCGHDSGASADQQQARRLAGLGGGRAMDAGPDGAAGALGGDAPKVAEAEGVGAGVGQRGVMQIVAVRGEPRGETGIVRAAVDAEELGARIGDVDTTNGLVVGDAFGGGDGVAAKKGVGEGVGAVGVEVVNVDRHWAGRGLARVGRNEIERGIETGVAQEFLIGEQDVARNASGRAEREFEQRLVVDSRDLVERADNGCDFVEVAGERARPAESVDRAGERGGDEFVEAADEFNAGMRVHQVFERAGMGEVSTETGLV